MLVSPRLTRSSSSQVSDNPSRGRLSHRHFENSAPLDHSSSPVSSLTSVDLPLSPNCSTHLSSPTPPSSSLSSSSTSTSSNSSTAATAAGLYLKSNIHLRHETIPCTTAVSPSITPALNTDPTIIISHVSSSPITPTTQLPASINSPLTSSPLPPPPPQPPLPPTSAAQNYTVGGKNTNPNSTINTSVTSTHVASHSVGVGPRLSHLVSPGGKRRDIAGKSPLHHADSDVTVGAAITTGLLHALRGAPSQERNAVFTRPNCDAAMLATFSGVGKHGLRLAELAASIVFRVVRRRVAILNTGGANFIQQHQRRNGGVDTSKTANNSVSNGVESGVDTSIERRVGRISIGQHNQKYTCDHSFRGPTRMDRYRFKDRDKGRGRGKGLVFSSGANNNGGFGPACGSGGGGLTSCGGGGLFGFSKAVSFHRDVKNRNCCMPGIVDDALNAAYRAIEATPWGRASSVSSTVALLRRGRLVVGARGIPTVLLVARRGSRTSIELVSGRPMEDACECNTYASAHSSEPSGDVDSVKLNMTANKMGSSNESGNGFVSTPTCGTAFSATVPSSNRNFSQTLDIRSSRHVLPGRRNLNHTRIGDDGGGHWQKDVDIDVDECNSINQSNRNHGLALRHNVMSVRDPPPVVQGRFSLPYTSRNPLPPLPPPPPPSSHSPPPPQLQQPSTSSSCTSSPLPLTSVVANAAMDDGGLKTRHQKPVTGYCDAITVRCFEVCRYHSHVIVSTSRLWNGECTVAPQRIVDVFARASLDTCVIDLSEALMRAAFGNSLPTHDTTILCARLR